jgi:hypothetical protein
MSLQREVGIFPRFHRSDQHFQWFSRHLAGLLNLSPRKHGMGDPISASLGFCLYGFIQFATLWTALLDKASSNRKINGFKAKEAP